MEKEEIIELQKKYAEGLVPEYLLSKEEKEKLKKLYEKQIEKKKEKLKNYKEKLEKYLKN